ncbi:MAG: ABC transporter ATP-binding protein [Oscillospiraceae bacterium]|nr:ABC transporter ATP-binding protein [Oscillospiraceae bacterium]
MKTGEYVKGYKIKILLGPLFKLLEATFELFVPLVVKDIIDMGIANNDIPYIIRRAGLLGILAAVGFISSILAQYFAANASVGICTRMRHALFEKIGTFSHETLDKFGTSTLVTRLTGDMNQVQSGINLTLRLLLRSPFVVFGAVVMAFTISPELTKIFICATMLLFIVVFAVMLVSIKLYKKVQSGVDRITGLTRENLTGARVIRAFCREEDEIEEFEDANTALTKIQLYTGRISGVMNPATFLIINIAIMALLYCGGQDVYSGVLTTGALIALYNYMSQILVELIKLANLSINIAKSIACLKRISVVLDTDGAMKGGNITQIPQSEYAVEFDDVTFSYPDAADSTVEHITFKAKKGETIGVIGATGAGKSSVVNLIPRFYDPSEGCVKLFGTDAREYDIDALRARIGIVPQKAVLFAGTIRDNIRWGNEDATDEMIEEAAKCAQALDVIEAKGGLDAHIEAGGTDLSGGQRQRLTIARALVRKPSVLILDDSASALDMATDARLRSSIASLDFDPTVFIVSQRAASVMDADKIIVLDDGMISDMGTHDELMERCSIYREIYELQTGGASA